MSRKPENLIEPIKGGFQDVAAALVGKKEARPFQQDLPLIRHEERGEVIFQRILDGYVNATAMCKAAGKLYADYSRLKTTQEFFSALSRSMGIPIDLLTQSVTTGKNDFRGTWIHPKAAIHLAQWLSPEFAVKVTEWVFEWLSGNTPKNRIPYHLRRYMANMGNVPIGHFSMLNEMTIALIAPLENMGYELPENMIPDISEGKMFCRWLREEKGVDTDSMPTYRHHYEDGRTVTAKAYPNELLADFRKHFLEVWLFKRSVGYFAERDAKAVPHLQKLLALPNYREIAGFIESK